MTFFPHYHYPLPLICTYCIAYMGMKLDSLIRGKLQLLELLLQLGADSRVRASNGWTAADFCKKTGQVG